MKTRLISLAQKRQYFVNFRIKEILSFRWLPLNFWGACNAVYEIRYREFKTHELHVQDCGNTRIQCENLHNEKGESTISSVHDVMSIFTCYNWAKTKFIVSQFKKI